MSVFQLLLSLCKEINGMMQKFWWGHMTNNSKIHWMSWERMWRSKNERGLGFRDLVIFNQALLAKQCWRLYQSPSLTALRFKAKYFSHSFVLDAPLRSKPSYA